METKFSRGICIDNEDPLNLGRIRVVPYEIFKDYISISDIVYKLNIDNKSGAYYTEWSLDTSKGKQADPYLSHSFLPPQISIKPKPGQVVRLIYFEDAGKKASNYIGPITFDDINMSQTYVEHDIGKNYNVNENISNSVTDAVFSGYNNEQINLGDNRILMRLDHISNNTRKKQYPLFQISKFTKNLNYKVETVTKSELPEIYLDYILEINFDYVKKNTLNDKNIRCTVNLFESKLVQYNGKLGLTNKLYSQNQDYFSGDLSAQYTTSHVLEFNDIESLDKAVEDIISSYKDQKTIKYYKPTDGAVQIATDNKNGTITVYNRLTNTPNQGGGNNEPTAVVPNLNNFVVRIKPYVKNTYTNPSFDLQSSLSIPLTQPIDNTSLEYVRFQEFNTFIGKVKKYTTERFLGNQNLQTPVTSTVKQTKVTETEVETTVHTLYADKFLLLSSVVSPNYLENPKDGMSLETVSKFLSNLNRESGTNIDYSTYGLVRGEELLKLLNEILNVFLTHGHSIGQVENSLSKSAESTVNNLIARITEEINGNSARPTSKIINHNLRLN
jgi:hypothetical protein